MSTPLDEILSSGRDGNSPGPDTTEQPVSQEQPTTGAETQPADGEAEPETHALPDGRRMVPLEAVQAERGKVKRYTEQIASFEKRLDESNAAWERRMAQLLERLTPPQQPQQAPDWFDDPAKATQHAVAPHFQQFEQVLMANAKLVAGVKFGDDEVEKAEQAFINAVQSQRIDPADYHKVVNHPNRYAAAVQWHKRQQAQAEIGDDPAAFREKVRQEVLAELQNGGAAPNGQQAQALNLPSNLASARNVGARTGPAWGGPKPLGEIFKR